MPEDPKQPPFFLAAGHPANPTPNPAAGAEATPPPPPPPPHRAPPAEFPKGFWRQLDYLLQHREALMEAIRLDHHLTATSLVLILLSIAMAAIYGGVMGATNLFQGSAMGLGPKLGMIAITAIKVPILFLLTLLIVFPPIYVSNAFAGAKLSFRQVLTILLACTALTTVVLASMATVAGFFALTSRSYDFIKLLHVVFFAYAGLCGLGYLERTMSVLNATSFAGGTSRRLRLLWLVLYMFVGMQLAWVLRPFVSSPGEPFQVFRARSGSFYESVVHSIGELIRD